MVILVAALGTTGLLLWLFDRDTLNPLGLPPTKIRLTDFVFGLVVSALLGGLGLYLVALVTGARLTQNPDFTTSTFFNSSLWMVRSVVVEELIFRGVLLYFAIRWLGINIACIMSAVAFGVYHWFSYQVIGDVTQMIYILLLTGAGGLLFAYSFALTKSMYLPVGLHLGWNIVGVVIFSQGPLGDQLLIAGGGKPLGLWSIPFFAYQVGVLPLITFLYVRKKYLPLQVADGPIE